MSESWLQSEAKASKIRLCSRMASLVFQQKLSNGEQSIHNESEKFNLFVYFGWYIICISVNVIFNFLPVPLSNYIFRDYFKTIDAPEIQI